MRYDVTRLVMGVAAACLLALAPDALASDEDPLEGFNRTMFDVNDSLDTWVLEPAARGWDFVLPRPAQSGVQNFFLNLDSPARLANDLLQGEIDPATVTVTRFFVNTTVGVAGIFDVARTMGLPRHDANFGQTLGKWGVPAGPYLVLPFWGSSDIRDTTGLFVDSYFNVITFFLGLPIRISASGVNIVNSRALVLDQIESVRDASLDLYTAARSAYIQRREEAVLGQEEARARRDEDLYFFDDEEPEPEEARP